VHICKKIGTIYILLLIFDSVFIVC